MIDKHEKIKRTAFLKSMGLSTAAIFAAAYCSSSCINEPPLTTPVTPFGNTIDLSSSQYSKLNTIGNYVIVNNIVIAHTSDDKFVAVPLMCSHEGQLQVTYRNTEFYCTAHGARFSNTGKGLNSEGSKGLMLYTVTQSGTILTIT